MELWIRSQDKKNLVKIINQIGLNYANNNMIIANYQPDFIGTQGEYYEELGIYKSKERALEVLDEIQNKINNYENELYACKNIYVGDISYPTYIYEMPKE